MHCSGIEYGRVYTLDDEHYCVGWTNNVGRAKKSVTRRTVSGTVRPFHIGRANHIRDTSITDEKDHLIWFETPDTNDYKRPAEHSNPLILYENRFKKFFTSGGNQRF